MYETLIDLISVFAFILSLASWVYILISQRRRITIKVYTCRICDKSPLFYMSFENMSRLPVSITRITLISNDTHTDCVLIPKEVLATTKMLGNEIQNQDRFYSEKMPINLDSLSCKSGYVYFESEQQLLSIPATSATFRVYTNRGRLRKKTLQW